MSSLRTLLSIHSEEGEGSAVEGDGQGRADGEHSLGGEGRLPGGELGAGAGIYFSQHIIFLPQLPDLVLICHLLHFFLFFSFFPLFIFLFYFFSS